jgi:hypothetical protein
MRQPLNATMPDHETHVRLFHYTLWGVSAAYRMIGESPLHQSRTETGHEFRSV